MTEPCPHCGSEDYGPVNEGHERCCLSCGYDTENGTLGVCPGGMHPRDGSKARSLCCDFCYDRAPRDLAGHPRWRSARKAAIARARRVWSLRIRGGTTPEVLLIEEALVAWLRENPAEPAAA